MKIFNVTWSTNTAGPSPDYNNRTEIFLSGCQRAIKGNACKNCFNSKLWDSSKVEKTYTPKEIAFQIFLKAPNKYITIGGGEPTDQLKELVELCKELKSYGFHIIMYTWRSIQKILVNNYEGLLPNNIQGAKEFGKTFKELLNNLDIVIDGEFKEEEKMYKEYEGDGTFSSVGSGNQIIWDIPNMKGVHLRDIEYLAINPSNNKLYYIEKEKNKCHK